MNRMIKSVVLGLLLSLLPGGYALAEEAGDTEVGSQMPPRVKALLVREMQAVLAASQDIFAALVQGQHEVVADKAQAIHDSFILKQEMTPADRKGLMAAVPQAFVDRDRAFHKLAAQLAEAARNQDLEKQRAFYGDMLDACVACHKQHAADRFPALQDDYCMSCEG